MIRGLGIDVVELDRIEAARTQRVLGDEQDAQPPLRFFGDHAGLYGGHGRSFVANRAQARHARLSKPAGGAYVGA